MPVSSVHPYSNTSPTAGVASGVGGRISPVSQHYGYPPIQQQFPPGAAPFGTTNGISGYPNSHPGLGLNGYPAVDPNRRHSGGYPPIGYLNNVNHAGGYPPQMLMQNQGGYPAQFGNGYPPQINNFNTGYPPFFPNNAQIGYPPMNGNMYPPINNGIGPGGLYPPAQPPMSRPASAPVGTGYPPGYPFAGSNLYPPNGGYPSQPQAQAPTFMPRADSPSTISTPQPTYGRSSIPGAFPGSFPGSFPEEMGSSSYSNNNNFGTLGGHKQNINNGQVVSSQPFAPTVPGRFPGARSASPPELPPRK